jgi:hypothetical protein
MLSLSSVERSFLVNSWIWSSFCSRRSFACESVVTMSDGVALDSSKSKDLFSQNVSFVHLFWHYAFKEEAEVSAVDAAIHRMHVRKTEGAPLQSLEPDGQSIAIPIKQFDHGSTAVAEYEKRS